jgi:hypothetical protein
MVIGHCFHIWFQAMCQNDAYPHCGCASAGSNAHKRENSPPRNGHSCKEGFERAAISLLRAVRKAGYGTATAGHCFGRTDGHPGQMAGHPGQMAGHPGQMAGRLRQMAGHPGQMTGRPWQMADHPGQMADHPGQMAGRPWQMAV